MKNDPRCPKCKNPMNMYYGWWCPRCDKPELITTTSLNLLKVLRYLDCRRLGLKNRIWNYLTSYEILSNNSRVFINFKDFEENLEIKKDFELMLKEFPEAVEDDGILFDVSW